MPIYAAGTSGVWKINEHATANRRQSQANEAANATRWANMTQAERDAESLGTRRTTSPGSSVAPLAIAAIVLKLLL